MTLGEADARMLTERSQVVGRSPAWMYVYIIAQFVCQVALIVPGLGPARPLFRSAAFGTSLAILIVAQGTPLVRHPSRVALGCVLAILTLSALNPEAGGPLATMASFCFQLAIMAPVFWVARLRCSERDLERLMVLIWLFSTASAAVGVLQAWFPGRFQPAVSIYALRNIGALMIPTASGIWIPRPMGLTDSPGGAATGGYYAALLSIGIAILKPFRYARLAAAGAAAVGVTCLYLCQIRALLVMFVIGLAGILTLSGMAGRIPRFAFIAFWTVALFLVGITLAVALGGESTLSRFELLFQGDPRLTYQRSRGEYLDHAFEVMLPQYPLGAGLGRWGQVANYFGNEPSRDLTAEIQWLAWVIDGGIPLVITYPIAIGLTAWSAISIALKRTTARLELWATLIAGYNLASVALTFSYPIFMSAIGLEFWLVNAALVQAYTLSRSAELRSTQVA
jgi:hypothetical protein